MIERGEPAISDYLRTGQGDYSKISLEAMTDMTRDFDNMNFDIKRLCKRLSLQTSVTKTAAFTGTLSDEDYASRRILVIDSTAQTGDAVFTLQGSGDGGTTYYDIKLSNDSGTSSTTQTISAAATNAFVFNNTYKKYRLKLVSIATTITYSAYLIEESFTNLHRDLARAYVYRSLISVSIHAPVKGATNVLCFFLSSL